MGGLLIATWLAAAPVSARATPLLSGYGGPGQGSQTIVGSALLAGPGGSPGGTPGASGGRDLALPSEPTVNTGPRAKRAHARGVGGGVAGAAGVSDAVVASVTGAESKPLGLDTSEFVYAALVLATLALMALAAPRMARKTGRDRGDS